MEQQIVNYWNYQNQLDADAIRVSLMLVYLLVIVVIGVSTRRSVMRIGAKPHDYMSRDTSGILRGFGVVVLVLGHLSLHCIAGIQPLEAGGRWAVTIFLFISAVALTKTYGGVKPGADFVVRRLRRIVVPLWLTLLFFYAIDFIVYRNLYSPLRVLLNFAGIIHPVPPNPSAWFITWLLYLYTGFLIAVRAYRKPFARFLVLLGWVSVAIFLIERSDWLRSYLGIWTQYAVVFPFSFLVALHRDEIVSLLRSLYSLSRIAYVALILILVVQYVTSRGLYRIETATSPLFVRLVSPLPFLLAIVMIVFLLDRMRLHSGALSWLGRYSLEIYLIHAPFMVFYDLLLHRRPFVLFFVLYAALVIALSVGLQRLVSRITVMVPLLQSAPEEVGGPDEAKGQKGED